MGSTSGNTALETLKTSFNDSSEYEGCHPDDLSASLSISTSCAISISKMLENASTFHVSLNRFSNIKVEIPLWVFPVGALIVRSAPEYTCWWDPEKTEIWSMCGSYCHWSLENVGNTSCVRGNSDLTVESLCIGAHEQRACTSSIVFHTQRDQHADLSAEIDTQATGLDAWASRVKCPARFVSHLHEICIYIWVVYSLCFFCCLFITVTWWYVWCFEWASGNQEEVQACLVTLWLFIISCYSLYKTTHREITPTAISGPCFHAPLPSMGSVAHLTGRERSLAAFYVTLLILVLEIPFNF